MAATDRRKSRGDLEREVNGLRDVLQAILLANGGRLAIADAYYLGRTRQNIAVEHLDRRIIVYLEAPKAPEPES